MEDMTDYWADRITSLQLQLSAFLIALEQLLGDPHDPKVRAKAERLLHEAKQIPKRAA